MRNTSKGIDIGKNFPIYCVENGYIVNKAAEVTAAYKVILPEIFTVSAEEYETIHQCWLKAFRVLPDFTVIHKQDWFTREKYEKEASIDDSFLTRSFTRHFNERPYLDHTCYLFVTKTRRGRRNLKSIDSMILKGSIVPHEFMDKEIMSNFHDSIEQMEQIINDSGLIKLIRLGTDDILGTDETSGIFERHLNLTQDVAHRPLEDITIDNGQLRVGDKQTCLFTVASTDCLPVNVSTDIRYEPFSTDISNCSLSFAAPLGILLNQNHVYNQYMFIDNTEENIRELENKAKKMRFFSKLSSNNELNEEYIKGYIDNCLVHSLKSIRCHYNVMAWSENAGDLNVIKNETASAMTMIGCESIRHNTVDCPVMYWSSIPGNAGDFPREETFYSFLENGICLFAGETNYHDSLSPFGIKMTDRLTGRPIHVDLSEIWMKKGIINNRNKFVLGPSGTGKSFYMNHLIRQYYEQGSHIILVDMGNSYEGLCKLINNKTKGRDGQYFTYTEDAPIAFNPFYTDDMVYDIEKRESLKTLIVSLWKREGGIVKPSEDVAVERAMNQYLKKVQEGTLIPSFNTFYEFVRDDFDVAGDIKDLLEKEKKSLKELFDIVDFLYVLAPFYKGGVYDYLLNSDKDLDLLDKRFIVFEIDKIQDNKVLFPVVTLVIMEAYLNKMRRLQGQRKVLVLEEAWKAIAKEGMATYVKYLYKTVRKHFGEITVVTQEMDDIISSEIVKESIIANADCKTLLDQSKNIRKFDRIQEVLGLTDKQKEQILSINKCYQKGRGIYREVWFGFGSTHGAVYATEVSREEALCYSTEETEKVKVKQMTKQLGGDLEKALQTLASK